MSSARKQEGNRLPSTDRASGIFAMCIVLAAGVRLLPRPDLQSIAVLALTLASLGLALNLVVGLGGQLSLAHGSIFGVGAYTSVLLVMKRDWPFLLAVGAAFVVAMVVAAIVGWPSIRTYGLAFSITTLAFGAIIVEFAQNQRGLTGGATGVVGIPYPEIAGFRFSEPQDQAILAVVVIGLLLFVNKNLRSSGSGASLRAVGADEELARVFGMRPAGVRLRAFVLSGALAGVGGAVYGQTRGFIEPTDFGFISSFEAVVFVIVGGAGSLYGAVLGAVALVFIPEFFKFGGAWRLLIYGVFLLVIIQLAPDGLASLVRRATKPFGLGRGADDSRPATGLGAASDVAPATSRRSAAGGELVVSGVGKRFGGLQALNDVTFSIDSSDGIVGLIGPNGAGKTTLLAMLSGVGHPDSGVVAIGDTDVSHLGPEDRAEHGLRRTFQGSRVFDQMTVYENLRASLHLTRRVRFVPDVVLGRRAGDRQWQHDIERLLVEWNLTDVRDQVVKDLAYGTRAQVSLAMALAVEPRVLLLDEPLAGMTAEERSAVMSRLQDVADSGVTVLLIEHDVESVFNHCRRVIVLSSGEVIADGDPALVRNDPDVLAAYFGNRVEQSDVGD